MTRVRCLESTTGYWNGRGFNWEADREYTVGDDQLATLKEGFHFERLSAATPAAIQTTESVVAQPPRRKRGRPRKSEAVNAARLVPDDSAD